MNTYKNYQARADFVEDLKKRDFSSTTWQMTADYIWEPEGQEERDSRAEELRLLLNQSKTEQEFVEKMERLKNIIPKEPSKWQRQCSNI